MRWLVRLSRRIRLLVSRSAVEREMADEMAHHLSEAARELVARGATPEAAARRARLTFGSVEATKEAARDARGGRLLTDLGGDLRYALRQASRAPAHAAAVVLITAIACTGAGVSLALARAYLHRPLPFPEADRLVSIIPAPSRDLFPNPPNLRSVDWQPAAELFETTGAWDLDGFTLVGAGAAPEYVDGAWVSPGYFDLRGLQPAFGRGFDAGEFVPGSPVAIISHELWRRRFGGDSGVIGQPLRLHSTDRPEEDAVVTIVGVLPATPWAQRFSEVLRPLGTPRMFSVARLPRGVGLDEAAAALTRVVRAQLPEADSAWRMALVSSQDEHVYPIRPVLQLLLGAGLLLLVLAQSNVGALLVARGTTRLPELAVRRALGATRGRLVRQLGIEAALLGGAGMAFGLVCLPAAGRAAAHWIERYGGVTVPGGIASVGLDGAVFAAIAGAMLLTFLPLAVLPALSATAGLRSDALTGGRATSGGRSVALRRRLATLQVAVAVTLLAQGALLVQSVRAMQRTELGFSPERLLKAHLLLPRNRYPDGDARTAAIGRVLELVRATPGVTAATTVFPHPFRGTAFTPVNCFGCTEPSTAAATPQTVTPEYFATMGIGLIDGRLFQPDDGPEREPVAVISEALARRLWPGQPATGRRLRLGLPADEEPWLSVIGVVRDVRKTYGDSLYPDVYQPLAQAPRAYTALMVRTEGPPGQLEAEIRRAVAREDEALALSDVEPMTEVLAARRGRTGILAGFVGAAAICAFGLTLVGLYSVVAYLVRTRRREFAIRAALGASPRQVVSAAFGDAREMLGLGIVFGLLGALVAGRLARNQLVGVSPSDPIILLGVAAIVAVVAGAALLLPVRGAARVDLTITLRD